MFHVTMGKGMQIRFANGWTVSVQFGPGNYCDNYEAMFSNPPRDGWKSETAEIAAWDATDRWLDFGDDTVRGRVSAEDAAAFIAEVAAFSPVQADDRAGV